MASKTQDALLAAIRKEVEELPNSTLNASGRAAALRSLSLAYRHTVGGPQPGGAPDPS